MLVDSFLGRLWTPLSSWVGLPAGSLCVSAVCDVTLMRDAFIPAGAVIMTKYVCGAAYRIPASAIMASVTSIGDLAPVPDAEDCELHA